MWLVAALWQSLCPVTAMAQDRSILVLEQADVRGPFYAEIFSALRRKVNEAALPVTLYVENLDLGRFRQLEYQQALRSFLQVKYRDRRIGVVVAVGSAALDYAVQWKGDLWPNVPIVFTFVDEAAIANAELPADSTGKTTRLRLEDMVSAARAVVPNLKQVAIVGDPLETQAAFAHFLGALPAMQGALDVVDLTGIAMLELRKRLATLADDSAVLYTAVYSDGAGTHFPPSTALEMIAAHANRPIIAPIETYIGRGAIGGYVTIPSVIGEEAAELALQIIAGRDAASIPVTPGNSLRPVFDWRLMERWDVDEARLPPDSEVRYRRLPVWAQHPRQTAMVILVVLLQSALIAALLYERRRRHQAEIEARSRLTEISHMNRYATAGELSAQIAHEVNQPLGAILSSAEAAEILLEAPEPQISEIREILSDIKRIGLRASDVVVRLRRFLKKTPVEPRNVNLNAVVSEVLAFVSHQASARRTTVTERLEKEPLFVLGDPIQLQQVVLNLVSNAIDAVGHKASDRHVIVQTLRLDDCRAEIAVSDSGPGVDPTKLELVFDRFFTTKENGMGIGLSIVRTIVEAHGGTIRAENQSAGGAVFRVELPLAKSNVENGRAPDRTHSR